MMSPASSGTSRIRFTMIPAVAGIVVIGMLVAVLRNEARLQAEVERLPERMRQLEESAASRERGADLGASAANGASVAEACRAAAQDALRGLPGAPATADPTAATPQATPPRPEPTPENRAAFEEAQQALKAVLNNGTLGPAEAEALRQLRHRMTPDQVAMIASQLYPAINYQRVHLDPKSGPLF